MNGEEVGLGVWSVAVYSDSKGMRCRSGDDMSIDCVK